MSERYPNDAALLALERDAGTGVEYIPTGRSPYFLEFRRLVYRLLDAARRANDLRVYADGEGTIGVRGGRCVIRGAAVAFEGEQGIAVDADATTHVRLDADGAIRTSTTGAPADRTGHVPLAEVVSEAGAITEVRDLRGEALLAVADLSLLGVEAQAEEINRALAGAGQTVDAAALSRLTAGPHTDADSDHRHRRTQHAVDAEASFSVVNAHPGAAANVLVRFDLPLKAPAPTDLLLDPASGFLRQRRQGVSYPLLGAAYVQHAHAGPLAAGLSGELAGVVPCDATVGDVVLSAGRNMQSSDAADGVEAIVRVGGAALTATHPALVSGDGAGSRSTARGEGTPAAIRSDGTERVQRGDTITLDLARTASGTVSVELADLTVLIVLYPDGPE